MKNLYVQNSHSVYLIYHEAQTFSLDLALDIWVIYDLTQSHTAQQWTQQTFSPAAAVGTVEDSHAEITGEVGSLSKH